MPDKGPIARLTVVVKDKVLSVWDIPAGTSRIIGRGNEVHYQIKSGALSRRHCSIENTGCTLQLKDLGSLNGTLVNGKNIRNGILHDGDEMQLGPVTIKIETCYDRETSGTPTELLRQSGVKKIGKSGRYVKIVNRSGRFTSDTQLTFPSGTCLKCEKSLSSKDMATHRGIFKGKQLYCINCFCKGAGDFPSLAGYRIVKKIASGGMGEVYEAIQLSMERPVAFKLMKKLENMDERQMKRFFREARMGGKLVHPNIVGFIDAGRLEGACFITMEFVYGIDVKRFLEESGKIPWEEALRIAHHVATALDYASTRFNIVHRDIKPGNILVDRDNIVKLADFGLAKNFAETGLSEITQSQGGVGTLYYMAPEQITNARFADHRADIYSLGITLYEMIAGVRPFTGDKMMELVEKIREETPAPLTDLCPDVPADIWKIISKALSKKPNQRYQTAQEMGNKIQSLLKKIDPDFLVSE